MNPSSFPDRQETFDEMRPDTTGGVLTNPAPESSTSTAMPLTGQLVDPFPTPTPIVISALHELQLEEQSPSESHAELSMVAELARPWDPATCHGPLRAQLWTWLDQVARWINEQQLWNLTTPGIPDCWPAHPHIVHDLAAIACARFLASYAYTPDAMIVWHQHALPGFLDRIQERLGDGCAPGRHQSAPRDSRDRHYGEPTREARRAVRFQDDVDLHRGAAENPGSAGGGATDALSAD